MLPLSLLEPLVHVLRRRCHLDIDSSHHCRTLRTLDTKRLSILAARREEAVLDLRVDPTLQAGLAGIDEMVAFAGRVVVWESAGDALHIARKAKIAS